jgi:hypothetical protein
MDEGESWWLIKFVFWGILIFIVLKLGLVLLPNENRTAAPHLGGTLSCSYRGQADGVGLRRPITRFIPVAPFVALCNPYRYTNAHWVGLRVATKSRACFHFEAISCRLWLRSPFGRLTEQSLLRRFQLLM